MAGSGEGGGAAGALAAASLLRACSSELMLGPAVCCRAMAMVCDRVRTAAGTAAGTACRAAAAAGASVVEAERVARPARGLTGGSPACARDAVPVRARNSLERDAALNCTRPGPKS